MLSAVVQAAAGPMPHTGQDLALRDAVVAQPVRDDLAWLVLEANQQALEEALGGRCTAVQVANARRRASSVLPYIEGARRAGARTLAEIAEALMGRGVPAPRGGDRWSPAQVRRTLLTGSTSGGG